MQHKKLNKYATTDLFDRGHELLSKNIRKIRTKAVQKYKRKYHLILMSMKYFVTQMQYQRAILESRIKKPCNNTMTYVKREWDEDGYHEEIRQRRLSGEILVKTIMY